MRLILFYTALRKFGSYLFKLAYQVPLSGAHEVTDNCLSPSNSRAQGCRFSSLASSSLLGNTQGDVVRPIPTYVRSISEDIRTTNHVMSDSDVKS